MWPFSGKNKKISDVYVPSAPKSSLPTFRFAAGTLDEYDARFSEAYCKDNTIYCRSNNGNTFVIGYVSLESRGYQVQCEFDRGEIGLIGVDKDVYFSNRALCDRGITDSHFRPLPSKFSHVGKAYDFALMDVDGHTVGSISGDAQLAAAAFVCLVYECHMNSAFHSFYKIN